MTPAQFLKHFAPLTDTKGGVTKLRTLTLKLAFSGRLGEASPISEWRKTTIGEIATDLQPGFACSKKHEDPKGYVHLRTHNVATDGRLNFDLLIRVDREKIDDRRASLKANDVIFNNTNSQELVGKTCLVDRDYDYAFSNHLTVMRFEEDVEPGFIVRYFNLLLRTGIFSAFCNRWIGQAGINIKMLRTVEVKLPPLAEQRRIVAKVDELMRLCDQLEAQQTEQRAVRVRTNAAALDRMTQAKAPAEFAPAWQRLQTHFDTLFALPETVTQLRQTLLQLAVMGKLVEQDPNDEPAIVQLQRLTDMGGNLSVRRGVPDNVEIRNSVSGFIPPTGWIFESTAHLLQCGAIRDLKDGNHGGSHPKSSEFTEDGLPFITAAQVSDRGLIDYYGAKKVNGKTLARLRVGFAKPGDVIYTHKGSVGRVAICENDCVLSPQTTYYRVNSEVIDARYLRLYLLSPLFRRQVDEIKGQTTRDFVAIKNQYTLFIALPPLAEQKRISSEVDELMRLCDDLEAQLARRETSAEGLLEAMVAAILDGRGRSVDGKKQNGRQRAV